MIAPSKPCALALAAALAAPAILSPQSTDVLDPARAALVAHLVDRASRELSIVLADWRVATGATKAALEAEVAALAVERRAYLAESMARTPRAAWTAVLDDTDRADVDVIAPGNTAQPLTAIGTLDAACLETEPGIGSGLSYSLEDGLGMRWRLRAGGGALDREQVGAVVEVEGFALDGELLLDDGSVTTLVPAGAADPVVGNLRYQVVVADLQVVNGPLLENYNTVVGAKGVQAFTETKPLNVTEYYDEASFGQLALSFDYDELTVAMNAQVTVTEPCDQVEIRDAVIAKLEQIYGEWQQDDYYGIAIFVPWFFEEVNVCPNEANAAFVGPQRFTLLSTGEEYDLAYTWLPVDLTKGLETDRLHTLLHELGHTLGCQHSSTSTDDVLASPLSFCDYGDPFSPMNTANAILGKCESPRNGLAHHNAYHKLETLGWIDQAMIQEVNQLPSSSTQVFQLYPTAYSTVGASSTNNKRQVLKIARGDLGAVWVEYRREIPGSDYETKDRYVDVLPAGTLLQALGAGFLYVEPVKNRSAMFDPRMTIPNTHPDLLGWCLTHLVLAELNTESSFFEDCSDTTITVLGIAPPDETSPAPRLRVEVQTGPVPCIDVQPPLVVMKSPGGGITATGTLELEAEAWDYDTGGSEIGEVAFFHTIGGDNETPLGTVSIPPGSVPPGQKATASLWVDTHAFPNGSNLFYARAKDVPPGCCPNTGKSPTIKLKVLNESVVPTIASVAPANGATASVPFTAETNPLPASGIASVEYFLDPDYADPCGAGELQDGAHPAGCAYHAFFPAFSEHFPSLGSGRGAFLLGTGDGSQPDLLVGSLPPGSYTWWARAISNFGDTVLSELRTLTVTGSGPFAVGIQVTEGATVMGGATVSIPATVTADPGEAGYVDFFVDGVFLARDTTAPFTAPWTAPSGTASHVLRADAFGIGGRTATDDVTVQVP